MIASSIAKLSVEILINLYLRLNLSMKHYESTLNKSLFGNHFVARRLLSLVRKLHGHHPFLTCDNAGINRLKICLSEAKARIPKFFYHDSFASWLGSFRFLRFRVALASPANQSHVYASWGVTTWKFWFQRLDL